jgi:hypothetical protein
LGKLALIMGIAMNVPYRTKTGLEIGKYYQRDTRPQICNDMELIQSVLLGNYKSIRQKNFEMFLYFVSLVGVLWFAMVFAK